MAYEFVTPAYVQSDGTIMRIYIADSVNDFPAAPAGCKAFDRGTDKWYTRKGDSTWAEDAASGGEHPDLATHTGMGLASSHTHPYSSDTHNHDAAYSALGHSHGGGGGEAFPVGSVFISVVSTDPATLLGYGTWSAFGAGRVLVGLDSGDADFDAVEETGGAKTVTLTEAQMPAHVHVENQNSATTGGLAGWGARDTSTNTSIATSYSTASTGGGGAHSNVQPYIVVYMFKRTA